MLKTTHSFSLLLPILITFSLAIQFIPGTASAEVYKTDSFTLSLPLGWSLTKGPVKKDGGEMAVFGRNDRKAAFIIISGPFEPGNFKALAEKCAQQPGMEKSARQKIRLCSKSPTMDTMSTRFCAKTKRRRTC